MRVPPKKGIQGALLARITKILSDENEVLRLGTMLMDPELAQAIRLELEDEDNEQPPKPGHTSLVEEFERNIKREHSADGSMRNKNYHRPVNSKKR
jgi:transcription initiation factor TFIID subunit 5